MSPDAGTRNLLYVVNFGTVDVYSYPQGLLEGQITSLGAPYGDCSDANGHVYITEPGQFTNRVAEFAHGGTRPIRTLAVPGSEAFSCAVDPHSGDLAVTNYGGMNGDDANVAVFPQARKAPATYTDPDLADYEYCTYDSAGNLFVDGTYPRGYDGPKFAELPHGGKSLQTLNLNYGIGWIGALQWDGKYLAVGQAVKPYIFRFQISGSTGTLAGSTPLTDATSVSQFIFIGKRLVASNLYFYDRYIYKWEVLVYDYPEGGHSIQTIMKSGSPVSSVALSRRR
jgi:hypothetical protein